MVRNDLMCVMIGSHCVHFIFRVPAPIAHMFVSTFSEFLCLGLVDDNDEVASHALIFAWVRVTQRPGLPLCMSACVVTCMDRRKPRICSPLQCQNDAEPNIIGIIWYAADSHT